MIGLQPFYVADDDFVVTVRCFSALAFLPIADVSAAFDQLKLRAPVNLQSFVDYFETTYIRRQRFMAVP